MNIDKEYEDSKFDVVSIFRYRGRICVIVRVNFMTKYDGYPSYNGYVSFKKRRRWHLGQYEKSYERFSGLAHDGLTYDGYLGRQYKGRTGDLNLDIPEDRYFFGFDTLHSWNNAENASFDAVREKTIELADNMIKRRI